jgi:protein-S-isoprenylcysteine O-methyltransferase Ste14
MPHIPESVIDAKEPVPRRLLGLLGAWRLPRRLRATIYGFFYMTLVMAVLPWLAARWLGADPESLPGILAGGGIAAAGLALFVWCVVLMVRDGEGTQSPLEPPRRFVAVGPYRIVRNPMLLGNVLVLLGEAAMFASPGILIFAVLFFTLCHSILLAIEEPALRRRFGTTYEVYCSRVPRWLPDLRHRRRD